MEFVLEAWGPCGWWEWGGVAGNCSHPWFDSREAWGTMEPHNELDFKGHFFIIKFNENPELFQCFAVIALMLLPSNCSMKQTFAIRWLQCSKNGKILFHSSAFVLSPLVSYNLGFSCSEILPSQNAVCKLFRNRSQYPSCPTMCWVSIPLLLCVWAVPDTMGLLSQQGAVGITLIQIMQI